MEEIINKINEFKAKNTNIVKENNYYENITNYNNFEKIDLEIFSLIFYYFQFLELVKIVNDNDKDKKLKLKGKLMRLKIFNENYEKHKLIIIKAYNKKFIDSF